MPVEIVAEAAQGYEGDSSIARLLVRGAAEAKADAVKFQMIFADELATPDYEHYALFTRLEMPHGAWDEIAQSARRGGLRLYVDVFGERSLGQAKAVNADGVKIHSSDFFNDRLVRLALERMPRVFISLGGVAMPELEQFLARHKPSADQVCLMYGFQADPTPIELNHMRRLGTLRARFPGLSFGFMDHTDGALDDAQVVPLLSLAYGVCCIEKHLTLDRSLRLEDYISALDPDAFGRFVTRVRRSEQALGTDRFELTPQEQTYRRKAMKSVVTTRALERGEVVTLEAVSLKRSAAAADAAANRVERLEEAVGRTLEVAVGPNQPLTKDMLA
jgi:N,N'-diacetyllegionaminate synthase